ncbi:unnamed protein product [Prorocentrum cordatum]|uniref:Uncharacterized protein n=1 Tax=Prorocentrum cordatum TaxID=2364126 RepID=A0ABN9QIR3_9DINO|nr:unnamed protein product [Polarella glacialis]
MAPRPLARTLAVGAGVVCPVQPVFVEPMPTPEDCPHCGFAEWSCESSCSPLLRIEFNFSHWTDGCYEEIPGNDRTLFWDVDVFCQVPEAEHELGLTCDSMHDYVMHNPYVLNLDRCTLSGTSTMSAMEECHWTCKFGRPVYRCAWTFDPEGKFDHGGVSTLEKCWLMEGCTNSWPWKQRVKAACRPMDLWVQAGLSEQQKHDLQEQLLHLGGPLADATEVLVEALMAAGLTKEEADAAWSRYNATVQELTSHAEALNSAGLLQAALDGVDGGAQRVDTVLTTVLLQGVEYIQLVQTVVAAQAVKGVIVEAARGDYTSDDVVVEFSQDSKLTIEASLEARGAFKATLALVNLRRSETLGVDVLAALQATPGVVSDGARVSVESVRVEVVRAPEEGTVDLAEEVEAYRELVRSQQDEIQGNRETASILTIVVVAMGVLVVCLSVLAVAMCIARKRTERVLPPTESNRIVIGRPIGQTEPVVSRARGEGAACAKGGEAEPAPAGIVDAVPLKPAQGPGAGPTKGSGLRGLEV